MRHLGLMTLAALAMGIAPTARAGEPSVPTDTVPILEARAAGDLAVTVRGAGEDRVKFTLQNKTSRRLNVVIPPGLVAASTAAQGFQSMGLGVPSNTPGAFGAFTNRGTEAGFRSVPTIAPEAQGVSVSAGQTLEFHVPSVCLNYGITTPTSKHVFDLKDVDSYSTDARIRKALKSLAGLGTSQMTAQAVMWQVCNGLSFEEMAKQTVVKFNAFELSQAARIVEALDQSSGDILEPAYFQSGRVLVRVYGEGLLSKDAQRLARDLDGQKLLGLNVRAVDELADLPARPGTIVLNVVLTGSRPGQTSARSTLRASSAFGEWSNLGQFNTSFDTAVSDLTSTGFCESLDASIARNFVTIDAARRAPGKTTLRVVNRLPMTISKVTARAGKAGDVVTLDVQGIGPGRSILTPINAANAVVDRVELNGL